MTVLDENARSEFIATNPTWQLDGEVISKTFLFSDFNEAVGFVVRVALIAETADHHPDIDSFVEVAEYVGLRYDLPIELPRWVRGDEFGSGILVEHGHVSSL